jgi:hypothetical protein
LPPLQEKRKNKAVITIARELILLKMDFVYIVLLV